MPRKTVSLLSLEGTHQKYITNREAYDFVGLGKHEWVEEQRCIRELPRIMIPHAEQDLEFKDVWELRPSGGVAVWQMRTQS